VLLFLLFLTNHVNAPQQAASLSSLAHVLSDLVCSRNELNIRFHCPSFPWMSIITSDFLDVIDGSGHHNSWLMLFDTIAAAQLGTADTGGRSRRQIRSLLSSDPI
jgi:hypothetical protein